MRNILCLMRRRDASPITLSRTLCIQSPAVSAYTPRRAMLYVPGNDERKLKKIPTLKADCVCMDCEDGVALNRKEEARNTICTMLDELELPSYMDRAVRINSIDNPTLAEEDLKVIMKAKRLPATLMVPKVNEPQQLHWVAEKLKEVLSDRQLSQPMKLVIFIESAIALIHLREILHHGMDLSKDGPFMLDGVVFGSDDFCADIGASRSSDASELIYARQKVVTTAKAYRLQAIDLVHIDFKDSEGLKRQSLEGARMGYTGKQVIHPNQISIVQEAFSPSTEKIEWAQELVKAFEDHQSSGKGAFTFRGSMIDMPLLLQAKNVLRMVDAVKQQ
uniref:Citrate lyase subunit beta-like protein, mitochondrial-like n=1 Tax=Saccoglossus kowalevskii TaxID=10224 RepID=A0ABM0GZG1_SACKO|nr:PREDICTED: citrate lyase subunit beta-like protein, mitochondrial-like [Saccoglossus kowalevskii]